MQSTAQARHASRVDTVCHSGVQPWSAGPIFPAIIAKVERYMDFDKGFDCGANRWELLEDRLDTQWYELTLDGRTEQYATREDAELVAIGLLGDPTLRARWNRRPERGNDHLFYLAHAIDVAAIPTGYVEPEPSVREHALYLAACERSVREGAAA